MKKIYLSFLFIIISFFIIPSFIHIIAQESTTGEFISDYQIIMQIQPNGTLSITENIQYNFGSLQKHGIFRNIPYTKTNKEGKTYKFLLSDISVIDENGNNYNFTQTNNSTELSLKIGDADKTITGKHTYIISYTVSGAITYFSDHDELYWNAIGGEWEVPIYKSNVKVELPNEIPIPDITHTCYIGLKGSENKTCSSNLDANAILFQSDILINPSEFFTIVVGFPKGFVAVLEPELVVLFWDTVAGKVVVVLLLLLGLFWYIILPISIPIYWYKYGRDPKVGPSVTAYFDPPKTKTGRELSAIETGALVDEMVHERDVFAIFIDLARRGYYKIIEKKKKDFYLEKSTVSLKNDTLKDFEKILMAQIFKDKKTSVRLKDMIWFDSKTGKNIKQEIESIIYKRLVEEGYFPHNPNKIRILFTVIGIFALFSVNILLFLVAIVFGRSIPRKTWLGAQEANKAKSLRNFLKSQERHFDYAGKKEAGFSLSKQFLFEKFLPYALAFGVEKEWAKRFSDIKIEPPNWYKPYSTDSFTPALFASNLHASSRAVSASMTPTSSSSGFSSGFSSGGGFSGGGGGGGGGGSW